MTDRPAVDAERGDPAVCDPRKLPEARPALDDPQPGHVRGRGRRPDHDDRLGDPGVRRRAARRRRRARLVHGRRSRSGSGSRCCSATSPRRSPRAAARPRQQALRAMRTETIATLRDGGAVPAAELRRGDVVVVEAGRADPRRRHRDRGHRLGRRVGGHRRVGAGDPRGRRRPLGGHGRDQGAVGPDRGRDHAGAGQVVPRPDDRPRRGRRAGARPRTRSRSGSCSPG